MEVDLSQQLYDLWQIENTERQKAITLLSKIFIKIISNPSERKYADLNFHKILAKFSKCRPAFYLLYTAGFKQSIDGKRLKWINNDHNIKLLHQVNKALKQKPKIIDKTTKTIKPTQNKHKLKIQQQSEMNRKELIKQKIADSRKQQQIKAKQAAKQKEISRQQVKKHNEWVAEQNKKQQERERKLQQSQLKYTQRKKQQHSESTNDAIIATVSGGIRKRRPKINKDENVAQKVIHNAYICDNLFKYLRDIDSKNKSVVIGYIRGNTFNNQLYIPLSIVNYCIVYLYARIEQWDDNTNDIEDSKALMFEDRFTVCKTTTAGGHARWVNVFGVTTVSINSGIHEWTVQISTNDLFEPYVVIGIVPTDNIKNDKYMKRDIVSGWIIDDCLNGYGLQTGCGTFFNDGYDENDFNEGGIGYIGTSQRDDVIRERIFKMIYDTKVDIIKYEMDDEKLGVAMIDVPKQKYNFAVSIVDKCKIKLIDYKHFPFDTHQEM